MTYREKFAKLYPDRNPATAHKGVCPDIIPGVTDGVFDCPGQYSDNCAACWDREIPGTEATARMPSRAFTPCAFIKKALACCAVSDTPMCHACPYREDTTECSDRIKSDALAYIETLEERLQEVR